MVSAAVLGGFEATAVGVTILTGSLFASGVEKNLVKGDWQLAIKRKPTPEMVAMTSLISDLFSDKYIISPTKIP